MAKFRKRALVDAEQFLGPATVAGTAAPSAPSGVTWMASGSQGDGPYLTAMLQTLEGPHALREKDWIVTNPAGEKYNVSDEVFRSTYEPVGHAPVLGDCFPPSLPTAMPAYPQREGEPAWKGTINNLLGALRGIEWQAGSSPDREVLDSIGARAAAAIKVAGVAGFVYNPGVDGSADSKG